MNNDLHNKNVKMPRKTWKPGTILKYLFAFNNINFYSAIDAYITY